MTKVLKFQTAMRTQEDIKQSAAKFPGSHYGELANLTREKWEQFEKALVNDNEEGIQSALTDCPYLMQYVIRTSGHHGTWVFPKQMIRTKRTDATPGLIPDFLIATQNSLGFSWHIVELKRPSVQFSNAAGNGYSTVGHKGIAQCAAYASHFREYIETIRSNIGVEEIIPPKSVVLVIGDSTKETSNQRICRSNFDGIAKNVEIVTYDRIVRGLAYDRPDWVA